MKSAVVFVDIETGGLSPDHPDIQIAMIAVGMPEFKEIAHQDWKIQFDVAKADPEVLAGNNYSPEAWAYAKPEGIVCHEVVQFLRDWATVDKVGRSGKPYRIAQLAGHNVSTFDGPRLERMVKHRWQQFYPADNYFYLDTMHRALWYFAERGERPADYKLGTLCRHFGVSLSDEAHDALVDLRANVALARALCGEG